MPYSKNIEEYLISGTNFPTKPKPQLQHLCYYKASSWYTADVKYVTPGLTAWYLQVPKYGMIS